MSDGITAEGEKRSQALESLRALCALGVLSSHALRNTTLRADTVPFHFIDGLSAGVYVFFVLSGFLIYRPFARRDFADGGAVQLTDYFRNRALRILPVYYAMVVILLLLQSGGATWTQWWRFLTLTQNRFADTMNTLNPPVWTLIAEIEFYVLLPLLASAVRRCAKFSLFAGPALIVVLATASVMLPPDPVAMLRWPLAETFYLFAGGMLLAILDARGWQPVRSLPSFARSVTLWLAVAFGLWAAAILHGSQVGALMTLAGMLIVGSIVAPLGERKVLEPLESRWLVALGLASYSLYLWHYPLLLGLLGAWPGLRGDPLALYGSELALAITIAALSYKLVESPFLRFRRRWSAAADATKVSAMIRTWSGAP